MTEKEWHGLGCLKDPTDNRDLPMGEVLERAAAPPPADYVDYTDRMSPVRDQGAEGTCVGFASVVGVREYQEKKEDGRLIELSPRYVYYHCKQIDGNPGREGTYLRVAMKVLLRRGVCREECWPYRPYQTDSPCKEADKQARSYRIRSYARLAGVFEMERTLTANGPFLAGVWVFPSWFENNGGKIPLPSDGEESVGGHAVCVVGYSRERRFFKFKNSWGKDWGEAGYGYLSYDYLEQYSFDSWSVVDLIAADYY